ncbi:MAG: methyltransferase domain-containing protein [bacterium]|nr:methyltransferase domain-containing protein [bacterium]
MSDQVSKQVESHFDQTAKEFDSIYTGKKGTFSRWLDQHLRWDMYERYRLTLEECRNMEGKSLLDIGCGSGRFDIPLAKKGARRIVGLDFAPQMLELARAQARAEGVEDVCEFIQADFIDYDFGDETFDITIAIGLFDYIKDPEPFLSKMRQITRSKLIASFPLKWTYRAPIRKVRLGLKGCPCYFFTIKQVKGLFQKTGFKTPTIQRIGKIYLVISS